MGRWFGARGAGLVEECGEGGIRPLRGWARMVVAVGAARCGGGSCRQRCARVDSAPAGCQCQSLLCVCIVGRPPPPCATYPPCVAAEGEPQSPRSTPPPQPGNEDSNIYTRTITIDIGILLAHNPHGRGVVGRRHGRSAPRPPPPPSSPTHLGNTLRGWGQAFPEHTRRTYPILPRTSAHNIIAPTQHEPASQAQALAWR